MDNARYEEDRDAAREFLKLHGSLLDRLMPEIEADAKRYVPVLSGFLRTQIGYEVLSNTRARLFADTEYAAAVENGYVHWLSGRHIPAQPYLRPAVYKHRDPS